MKTKEIVANVNKTLLSAELTEERFVRKTNKGNNEIYVFDYHEAPNLMFEVARLREITFRSAGGGTGNFMDIDKFDFQPSPYKQLIVWDPSDKEIVGGYRFAYVPEITGNSKDLCNITFSEYFKLSLNFTRNYLPWAIELGRAFVQPKYQSTKNRKSIFSLDNLWDGLGALTLKYPFAKYFYGKVTLYKHFPGEAKYMLLEFLYNHFGETGLLMPLNPVHLSFPLDHLYSPGDVQTIERNYNLLSKTFRKMGIFIPPLVNAYIKLSPSMKVLGTFNDKEFGDVDETAILITIADIYPGKIERHLVMNTSI